MKIVNKNNKDLNLTCKCPICGGLIIEENNFYSCSNMYSNRCKFKISSYKIDFKILENIKEFKIMRSILAKAKKNKGILSLPCGNCGSQIIKKR